MGWWFFALLIIVVIVALILLFAPQTFYPIKSNDKQGVYKLSNSITMFDSNEAMLFIGGSTATFQGLFYIIPRVRTPTAIACGTAGNPSCEDGRFQTCNCGSSRTCGGCKRNGYYPLINISNVCSLEIMTAPDAGRQGKALAHLAVQTETNVDASNNAIDASGTGLSQNYVETIPLPEIPLQKWTMITIVREGRRFDVYYNDTLVVSRKTNYFMTLPDDKQPLSIGDSSLGGYATMLKCTSESSSGVEIAGAYSTLTDTRGAPYVTIPEEAGSPIAARGAFQMPTFSLPEIPSGLGVRLPSFCPTGSCTAVPNVRPAQPWLEWDTDYA